MFEYDEQSHPAALRSEKRAHERRRSLRCVTRIFLYMKLLRTFTVSRCVIEARRTQSQGGWFQVGLRIASAHVVYERFPRCRCTEAWESLVRLCDLGLDAAWREIVCARPDGLGCSTCKLIGE